MLNSLVLSSYSPIILPVTFTFGILSLEREMLYNRKSLLGLFFIFISLLIFYDRSSKNVEGFLISGLVLFYFTYVMSRYLPNFYKFNTSMFILSLAFIAVGTTKLDFYTEKTQFLVLSLLGIFISIYYLFPYERKHHKLFSISLPVLGISYSILVFSCIESPISNITA